MMNQYRSYPALFILSIVMIVMMFSPAAAVADNSDLEVEVIDLLHRPASEVLPIIHPFVLERGAIKGTDFKIIIKSTRKNIAQIKELIDKTDIAVRKLFIYISTDRTSVLAAQEAGVSGTIRKNDVSVSVNQPAKKAEKIIIDEGQQTSIRTRVFSTETHREQPTAQKVLVQEGQWAMIRSGKAIPVAQRVTNPDGTITESIHYKSVTSGFRVRPQLRGDKVHLDIQPQQQSLSQSGGGVIDRSDLQTTVSVRLGQWFELGGSLSSLQESRSGTVYKSQRTQHTDSGIFVKVELQQ